MLKEEHHCYGTAVWVAPFPAGTSNNMPSPKQSWSRRTLKILITCHNGPQDQDRTKQEVSCLCPKAIHDLPLANGEGNTKNLQTKVMSSCTVIIKQPKLFPSLPNYQSIQASQTAGLVRLKFGYKHIQRHLFTANGMTDDPNSWNLISHWRWARTTRSYVGKGKDDWHPEVFS